MLLKISRTPIVYCFSRDFLTVRQQATGASIIGQPRRNMNSRSVAPYPPNEPIYDYKKGSPERVALEAALKELRSAVHEVPIIIGGKEIKTSKFGEQAIPHEHNHVLARFSIAGEAEVKLAIESSLKARKEWAAMSLDHRIAIFLKAADLLTGPWRAKVSAATILGQSKNFFQSEIDCICEVPTAF
jgi:1-pyrroline-5-carboxylate dehydrogenase